MKGFAIHMKGIFLAAFAAFAASLSAATAAATAAAPRPAPRPALAARIADDGDVIGIVHWGLNTYTGREWGFGDDDPALLDPPAFDADQIAQSCKAGGLYGLVVVAKHHDGFCLWPTKTTDYNITRSPFRCRTPDGECRDYVKAMSGACRRAGLKFGVYCSPWDRHDAAYATDAYVATYHAQLRELLGGAYGDVFYAWFDGANGGDGWYGGANEKRKIKSDYYRMREVMEIVHSLQPGAAVFTGKMDDAELRWCGNERGFIDPDSRATTVAAGGFSADGGYANPAYVPQRNTGTPDGAFFRMCEADFPLRRGWFWRASENGTTKTGEYLAKLYVNTVGNGGTMNIGIAPDAEGRLCGDDARELRRFAEIRAALFADEVAAGADGVCSAPTGFNVALMREDVSRGELVDEWELVADGETLFRGKSIGNKRMRLLREPRAAERCEVRILRGEQGARVALALYRAPEGMVRAVLDAVGDDRETETVGYVSAQAAEGAASPSGGGRGGKGTSGR